MTAYERLTALDRFFVDIESYNTHMHVAAVMLFESAPLAIAGQLNFVPRRRRN